MRIFILMPVLFLSLLVFSPARAQIARYEGGSIYDLDPPSQQSSGNPMLESIIISKRRNNLVPMIRFNPRSTLRGAGRPVGRLAMKLRSDDPDKTKIEYCTASLIADDLILTNHHCIPGHHGVVEDAMLQMGYLLAGSDRGVKRYGVELTPVETDKNLDYAILRVRGKPGRKWGHIQFLAKDVYDSQALFIIHHPGGSAQHISRGNCLAASPALRGKDLRHLCDTHGGSSGAPIFEDDSKKVVGLHYRTIDFGHLNAGVRMSKILQHSPLLRKLRRGKPQKKKKQKLAIGVFAEPDPEPVCHNIEFNIDGETRCLKPGDSFRDAPDAPEMVVIPRGRFLMGSTKGDADEKPPHKVTISKPFALGKYEVTVGQFRAFVEATGHDTGSRCWTYEKDKKGKSAWKKRSGKTWRKPGFSQTDDHPVTCVSWYDAVAYAKWLSQKTGVTYRLPTEAEWEYAARAKSRTKYHFGNRISSRQANFGYIKGKTVKVGRYTANSFGLHDMHGNVWEWVHDWYGSYKSRSQTDPKGPNTGSLRVFRGGSWFNFAWNLRSAFRFNFSPDYRSIILGFRLLRQPS